MRQFGLIGFPLSHSFSKGYFANHFLTEKILDAHYENFPIESIDAFTSLWENNPSLLGLNVTIPYKKLVIPFLQYPSSVVQSIHACNCIKLHEGALYGYNTDVIGFEQSLLPYLKPHHQKALIFGTGGAAAAERCAVRQRRTVPPRHHRHRRPRGCRAVWQSRWPPSTCRQRLRPRGTSGGRSAGCSNLRLRMSKRAPPRTGARSRWCCLLPT